MTPLQQAIRDRLDSLVNDLEDLVRQEALRMVAECLSGATPSQASPAGRRSSASGTSRSAAPAGDVAAKVLHYVQQNPGVRAEAVRAALGLNKPAWTKASSGLIAEKRLTKRGQKRGTSYSAPR